MIDIIATCRAAWNSTKRAEQPDYDDLVESYRSMLTARAEGVIATRSVSEDAPFHSFENAVLSSPAESTPEPQDAMPSPDAIETLEEIEAARLDRAKRRDEATKDLPKPKKPTKKASSKKPAAKKKTAVRKTAKKKVAPKK